jgi:hypothetical protein
LYDNIKVEKDKSSSGFIVCEVVCIEDERLWSVPTTCHAVFEILRSKPVFRMDVGNVWEVDDFNFIFEPLTVVGIAIEMELKIIWRMLLCHPIKTVDKLIGILCSPFTADVINSHFHNPIIFSSRQSTSSICSLAEG